MSATAMVLVALIWGQQSPAQAGGANDGPINLNLPCAAKSLYVLLRLANKEASFTELQERVGHDRRSVSAREMCQIAAACGLPLEAVRVGAEDIRLLEDPWIAYLQPCAGLGKGVGHYVVGRLSADGRTVQFIDPPREPMIVPTERLFNRGWCQIALVPASQQRPVDGSRILGVLLAGAGVVAGLLWMKRLHGTVRAGQNPR